MQFNPELIPPVNAPQLLFRNLKVALGRQLLVSRVYVSSIPSAQDAAVSANSRNTSASFFPELFST
jgi:hypothetical protein